MIIKKRKGRYLPPLLIIILLKMTDIGSNLNSISKKNAPQEKGFKNQSNIQKDDIWEKSF